MRAIRHTSGRTEEDKVERGALTSPPSNIERIDRQLAKIESKTTKIINKHIAKEEAKSQIAIDFFSQAVVEPSLKHSQTIVQASLNHSPIKCKVSYIDYLMMKGIRKEILKYVKENMFEDNEETYSFIDSDEIIKRIKTSPSVIRDTIYKLKKEGWFIIENQQYSRRLVKINQKNYQK